MPRHEDLLISTVLRGAGVRSAIKLGVTRDLFLKRRAEWMYLEGHPDGGRLAFKTKFPDFKIYVIAPDELEHMVEETRTARLDYELGAVFTKYQRRYGQEPSTLLITKMADELSSMMQKFSRGNDVNIVESWQESLGWVRQRKAATQNGTIVGYPYGLPTLDEELGGIQPPDLVTIVARQGEFKTWMSLYFAVRAMLAGAKVMYVSLEMSREQLAFRIHTLLSRVLAAEGTEMFKTVFTNTSLMAGTVNLKEYKRFLMRAKKRTPKGIIIPEAKDSGTVAQFQAKVEEHSPDLGFYDYFGLSIGDQKVENWVAAADMSRGFKQLCTRYNIPIVLNAQANRAAADSKEAPRLDQIAYTDNLGRDSDRVLSLRFSRGELTMYVAKNRFGAQGQKIRFDLDIDQGVIDEVIRGVRHSGTGFEDDEA